MKRTLMTVVHCLLFLFGLAATARAITYEVGPAPGQIPQLAGVPWGQLQPGDIVNIHGKLGGYREIIQISASGTAAQPIVIRGIPDPVTGALPVIDGDGAVMDPKVDFRDPVLEKFGTIIVSPRAKGYVYGVTFPSWITIESLAIRNALYDPTATLHFTDQRGAQRIYDPFACGIYIEFAHHLTIRGCEISFNGNGVFANSKNLTAQYSADLLIEKNYFHDNGQPEIPGLSNAFHEHHIYVEAVGAVYQYNRFGPLRANCHGCMIKDRSSGTIIRYNEVVSTDASNIFAIVDPQGGSGWIETQPDYRDAYVYGNTITLLNTSWKGSINVVWFGAYNGPSSYPTHHRGTLHFYHNTVVNYQPVVSAFSLTDPVYIGSPTVLEKVDCRNNIFYTSSAINANSWNAFHFVITPGVATVDLGINWVSPGTLKTWTGHPFGGTVNGWSNLIVGNYAGLNEPGFVALGARDYHLGSGADAIDAAGPLAASVLALGRTATSEYVAPQASAPRTVLGANADLGAFETSAIYLPPPLNRAPVTLPSSYNLVGPAPAAINLGAFDADGDPLQYGYTAPGLTGTLSGTPPNLVYTPPAGSGAIMIGYNANDGKVTSAPGFIFISYNSAANPPPSITLANPPPNGVVARSAPVALTATAIDPHGIKKVEFYVGYKLVGTVLAPPYTFTWSSANAGQYQVVAKAYDTLNAAAFSPVVLLTVQ